MRSAVAGDKRWRVVLKTSFKQLQQQRSGGGSRTQKMPQKAAAALARRQAYALMALHGIIGAPGDGLVARAGDGSVTQVWEKREEAARALVPTEAIARRMLSDVLAAAAADKATKVGGEGGQRCRGWAVGLGG